MFKKINEYFKNKEKIKKLQMTVVQFEDSLLRFGQVAQRITDKCSQYEFLLDAIMQGNFFGQMGNLDVNKIKKEIDNINLRYGENKDNESE